jgi:hypothetical protein
MPDQNEPTNPRESARLRAILEAERRATAESTSKCAQLAEQLTARMTAALEQWNASDDDRREGILCLGDLATLIGEYQEAWQQRALKAMGASPQPSDTFSRQERQQITGSRMFGVPFGEGGR